MNMVMWIMSDRTIPRSFRFMEGFGVHTFRLVNAEGKAHFVKFHWKPKQGLQSVVWNEALKVNGDGPRLPPPRYVGRDRRGRLSEWDLGMQVFDEEFADTFEFDVLDATKIIPEEQVPVEIIGTLTLDANVDWDFAETEQVAFCTFRTSCPASTIRTIRCCSPAVELSRHTAPSATACVHAPADQCAENAPTAFPAGRCGRTRSIPRAA